MRVATTFSLHGPEYPSEPLDEPKWLLNSVSVLTGVNLPVLKAWTSRAPVVVPLSPFDQDARGKGSARVFTLRRVLAIAITAELVRLGIAPAKAGALATTFMDDFIVGERKGNPGLVTTLSKVKAEGFTKRATHWRGKNAVLVAYPETDTLWVGDIKDDLEDVLLTAEGTKAAAVILFYGAIVERLQRALDHGKNDQPTGKKRGKRARTHSRPTR